VRLRIPAFRKPTSVVCPATRSQRTADADGRSRLHQQQRSLAEIGSRCLQAPIRFKENATCSERLDSCSRRHAPSAFASVRRLCDDTRGRCGRHDNSRRWQRETATDVFRAHTACNQRRSRPYPKRRCDPMVGPRSLFWQSTSPSPASCPSPEPELPGPAWARLTGFLHATGRI
jgi:hypothetical protein